jgi:hypothetical protein
MPRRDDDDDPVAEVTRAYDKALALIAEPDIVATEGAAPGFHSSPPWNAAAANAVMDIHAAARRGEAALRELVAGANGRDPRGGSDANTHAALAAITALAEAAPPGDVDRVMGELRLVADDAAALPAIDEADRWEPLPRQPGQQPYRCPYCHTPSLRFLRGKMIVACRRPMCKDTDGNRPAGRIDRPPRSAEPSLLWNDGLVT